MKTCVFTLMKVMCLSLPTFASTVAWDFSTPGGALGTSQNYTSTGDASVVIAAYGYNTSGNAVNLFGKHDGGDENGLGLAGNGDHEIEPNEFIQLDVTSLFNMFPSNIERVKIGSVQRGEGFNLFVSNTLGQEGTKVATGSLDDAWFTVPNHTPGTNTFLSIGATKGDVLLSSLQSTMATPEPATMALVGGSLIALACFRRRRKA